MTNTKDNPALVWITFQSGAVRWRHVRSDASAWPAATRDALDVAADVHELVMLGDVQGLRDAALTLRRRVTQARKTRSLNPERRTRAHTLARVEAIRIGPGSDLERAKDIITALWNARAPGLGATRKRENIAKAEKAVERLLEAGKTVSAVVRGGLRELGVPHTAARTFAGR